MIPSRVRLRFRYAGDPTEVTLKLTIDEARAISDGMQNTNYDSSALFERAEGIGIDLEAFLDASEESDSLVIEPRRSRMHPADHTTPYPESEDPRR